MFWFMLIALVVVVAAVALAVLGNGGTLPEAEHDRIDDPLPADRPVHPADLDTLRLDVTLRGYRMSDVDDVLDRVGAELAERDARIAELEAALAGAHDAALGAPRVTTAGTAPGHTYPGQGYEGQGYDGYGGQGYDGPAYGAGYGDQHPPQGMPPQGMPPRQQGPSLAKDDPWAGRDTGEWDGGGHRG